MLASDSSRFRRSFTPFRLFILLAISAALWLCFFQPDTQFPSTNFGLPLFHPHAPRPPPPPQHAGGINHGDDRPLPPPTPDHAQQSDDVWSHRAQAVKKAFLHAWKAYKRTAYGSDEILPVSNLAHTSLNGWGVTLIDSMDTLWLMGLKDEFDTAVEVVSRLDFRTPSHHHVPFFETVIRYLGGLLAAYALSGEPILLSRADTLGQMLLPIFNTTSGLPLYAIDFNNGDTIAYGWTGGRVIFAEIASCQMEYKYLAHLTGRREYFEKVDKVMEIIEHRRRPDGLFDTFWDYETGKPSNEQATLGGCSDSSYEYLLKQYLLSGRSETRPRDLYMATAAGALHNLTFLSRTRNLMFTSSLSSYGNPPTGVMDHLSCFYPGLLALGAHLLSPSSPTPAHLSSSAGSSWRMTEHEAELHRWAAQGLAQTCYTMYADSPVGLGAEESIFRNLEPGGWQGARWVKAVEEWDRHGRKPASGAGAGRGKPPGVADEEDVERKTGKGGNGRGEVGTDYIIRNNVYLLRPEVIETYFVMWKTTGDLIWRERGWKAFEAIEKYTKTTNGYASIYSVDRPQPEFKDEMPSYFLAETLKYLYLLFIDEDLLPLDKWVFTTEAHPLPVFEWRDWERKTYGL